ncbi:7-cyano-7-deazaguanine synthase [Abditibacteriota bacterium]|nr:7-cyano-7-deazaguanine synthase [Abditibacteriota bacterium]
MKTALLLSGGMDSISLLWWKRPDVAITVEYGQLASSAETQASRVACRKLGIYHQVLTVDCSALGSGDMAGSNPVVGSPSSDWWPYRNQLLITLAAMRTYALGVTHLWIGTVKSDSTHVDGTPGFIDAINRLTNLQEGNLIIEAPAIDFTTVELVKESGIPREFLAWAHSCHKANVPCGVCRGCNKYFQTLRALGYDMDTSREPPPL